MRLRDLLDESTVKVALESVDKEECLAEMVDMLIRAGRIVDRQDALRTLLQREAQATTGIGKGVALPHGKLQSVSELVVALGTSREGIEFDSADGQPVHIVALLLANPAAAGAHLRALVEIARLVEVPGFFRRALDCSTSSELLDLIDSEE
ncbi:MAG: PTS sugar transporter subunit IIA [Pirellulaceae bacterium]|jgi:PTS system nitrogen regulatory IIA component|nr:PTS sugar transporter subunit IIA [Pirellulaceae bacterium]